MYKIKVGINGFGRIGRNAARIIFERQDMELVAINSRADSSSHAYLLKYDSVYGTLSKEIKSGNGTLSVDKKIIKVFGVEDPRLIPWHKVRADIVIDATGKFRTSQDLMGHLQNGVKYVVLSSPAKDTTKTLVLGVNENSFDAKSDRIISNSSCTTNCLATTLKVIHDNFKVIRGFMTTVHAVTDSQNLLDNSHKKEVRLRRASFSSIIPSSTGSAKDINKLIPDLFGKILCQALRVPLLTVSMINLVVEIGKKTSSEEINLAFKKASLGGMKNIMAVADEQLVSSDYKGSRYSAVIDSYLTTVAGGNLVNVYAWYDNEWGYTNRLVDMVSYIGKKTGLVR